MKTVPSCRVLCTVKHCRASRGSCLGRKGIAPVTGDWRCQNEQEPGLWESGGEYAGLCGPHKQPMVKEEGGERGRLWPPVLAGSRIALSW
jgi:hypothetical protein